uniref:Uncharacterized protein n=1 Tax=Lepeophtheirus salmonis TaxID=72036 RepID=A0A0K2VCV7_LEPSM
MIIGIPYLFFNYLHFKSLFVFYFLSYITKHRYKSFKSYQINLNVFKTFVMYVLQKRS